MDFPYRAKNHAKIAGEVGALEITPNLVRGEFMGVVGFHLETNGFFGDLGGWGIKQGLERKQLRDGSGENYFGPWPGDAVRTFLLVEGI